MGDVIYLASYPEYANPYDSLGLLGPYSTQRFALIWDGAPYHRLQEVKAFLSSVNDGLAETDWKIMLLQFAPNDPTQNPIKDVWLADKTWLQSCWHQWKNFDVVKVLFDLATHYQSLMF